MSATIVNLREEVVHRYVFELRYDLGQVYWDRAGRIARQLITENDGWDFGEIGLHNCRLQNQTANLVLNFGPDKLDLSQTQSADLPALMSAGEFGKIADRMTETVVRILELETFGRMGFRVWHLYPSADREQSYQPIYNLRAVALGTDFRQLGAAQEITFSAVVDRSKHMLRIAILPFEQDVKLPRSLVRAAKLKVRNESENQRHKFIDKLKADKIVKSFPQFGLLLDLDAYIEDPPYPGSISASDFIIRASEDFVNVKGLALAAR